MLVENHYIRHIFTLNLDTKIIGFILLSLIQLVLIIFDILYYFLLLGFRWTSSLRTAELNVLGGGGGACEILLHDKAVAGSAPVRRWIHASPTRPPPDPLLSDSNTSGSTRPRQRWHRGAPGASDPVTYYLPLSLPQYLLCIMLIVYCIEACGH